MAERITSMSRARFMELRQLWLDGTLIDKWRGLTPKTKSDKVEERQIRGMAMIYQLHQDQRDILLTDKWSELHIVKDHGSVKLEIIGRGI